MNLGVSEDCCNLELELDKVRTTVALKTDAIMALSTFARILFSHMSAGDPAGLDTLCSTKVFKSFRKS